MKKSNVYTRTGDTGTTALIGGRRVPKDSLRLESYGTVDELNSHLGLLMTYLTEEVDRQQMITIQSELFTLSSVLATDPAKAEPDGQALPCPVTPEMVQALEHATDLANDGLPGWRGFTLPGGCRGAAQAHVCRTVCRRAERRILSLHTQEPVPATVLQYINRLSDYLYVLSLRLNNLAGTEEILWRKSL